MFLISYIIFPNISLIGVAKVIPITILLWLVLILKKDTRVIFDKVTIMVTILFIYIIINDLYFQGEFIDKKLATFIYICFILLVYIHYIKKDNIRNISVITNLILIEIIISSIIAIHAVKLYPELAKSLASNINDIQIQALKLGISPYSDIYGKAFLGPSLMYIFMKNKIKKENRFSKILIGLSGSLCIVNVFLYSYTTAILLCTLMIILYASYLNKFFRYLIIFISLFILIFVSLSLNLFNEFVESIDNREVAIRLESIYNLICNGSLNDESGMMRVEYYKLSFNTFINNSLFGVGGFYTGIKSTFYGIGRHSEWLDFLARYGFVGGALLLSIFNTIIKRMKNFIGKKNNKILINLIIYCLVLGSINTIFTSNLLILSILIIIPCIIYNSNRDLN